ncbi:hypothetical protein TanjilG_14719 [Lupinus angustifolius]|nr:hypothetical protein TanjilG_14719 [Lupinus angustifolius]
MAKKLRVPLQIWRHFMKGPMSYDAFTEIGNAREARISHDARVMAWVSFTKHSDHVPCHRSLSPSTREKCVMASISSSSTQTHVSWPLFHLTLGIPHKEPHHAQSTPTTRHHQPHTTNHGTWPEAMPHFTLFSLSVPVLGRMFDAWGRGPEGPVPNPSLDRHTTTRSRRESSSSSPPTTDGFGTGTPVPNPQSQYVSREYISILLTSLAYIVPSTRGCSPWRPDAICTDDRSARAHAPGFAATAAPSYSSSTGPCPDGRVSAQLGTVTQLPVDPASPFLLTKNGPLGALDSVAWLNKAATPSYLFKNSPVGSNYPEGNFGGNQLLNGSISLSPLYPSPTYPTPLKSFHKVGLELSSTWSSFPTDSTKLVPLAVIYTDDRSTRAHTRGFAATTAPSYSSRLGPCPDDWVENSPMGSTYPEGNFRGNQLLDGMLSLEPIIEDQGRSAVQPTRGSHQSTSFALRVYLPTDLHTCQTPWSMFKDGPNGEPAGLLLERAGSPKETLLRLLLPQNDKVQWTSHNVADSKPSTSLQFEHFTRPFNRQIAPPTKNGHAPPPIESRKSSQSVNPYYVWTCQPPHPGSGILTQFPFGIYTDDHSVRAHAIGFAATVASSYSLGHGPCPDGRVSTQLGTVTQLPVHPATPVLLTKKGPLAALNSMEWLNKAAISSYLFKNDQPAPGHLRPRFDMEDVSVKLPTSPWTNHQHAWGNLMGRWGGEGVIASISPSITQTHVSRPLFHLALGITYEEPHHSQSTPTTRHHDSALHIVSDFVSTVCLRNVDVALTRLIAHKRPLCYLQYPVAYLSHMQRILPAAQCRIALQGVPRGSSTLRGSPTARDSRRPRPPTAVLSRLCDARGSGLEGAIPNPSPDWHAMTYCRCTNSSSSPPTADRFGTGTPRLFTLETLCSYEYDRTSEALGPPDFHGPPEAHRKPRQYRYGTRLEFPLAWSRLGLVHHLWGPDRYALTRTHHRRSGSVSGATHKGIPPITFIAPYGFTCPLTRTLVRLLGSGHDEALTLYGSPFQGTWARSAAEDASPDYNSDTEGDQFSWRPKDPYESKSRKASGGDSHNPSRALAQPPSIKVPSTADSVFKQPGDITRGKPTFAPLGA